MRGAVCLALYPFLLDFPLEAEINRADAAIEPLRTFASIDELERHLSPGDVPSARVSLKLRRVLLLQNASGGRSEVLVARIDSLKEKHRKSTTYGRLEAGNHPALMLIGRSREHGTNGQEAVVNLLSVTPILRTTILRVTGHLTSDEMRKVSEKLVATLELDISEMLSRMAT